MNDGTGVILMTLENNTTPTVPSDGSSEERNTISINSELLTNTWAIEEKNKEKAEEMGVKEASRRDGIGTRAKVESNTHTQSYIYIYIIYIVI